MTQGFINGKVLHLQRVQRMQMIVHMLMGREWNSGRAGMMFR